MRRAPGSSQTQWTRAQCTHSHKKWPISYVVFAPSVRLHIGHELINLLDTHSNRRYIPQTASHSHTDHGKAACTFTATMTKCAQIVRIIAERSYPYTHDLYMHTSAWRKLCQPKWQQQHQHQRPGGPRRRTAGRWQSHQHRSERERERWRMCARCCRI